MSIISIQNSVEQNVGLVPAWISINTTDPIASILAFGYLNGTSSVFGITWTNAEMCLVSTSDIGLVWLQVVINGANTSLLFPTTNNPALSRSQVSVSRTLNSGFQISTTRDSLVSYSVDIATVLSLTTGQSGTVFLEMATDSLFTVNLQEVARFVNGNTGTLTIGLNLSQNVTGNIGGFIPSSYFCRLRTANNTGTPTFTYRSGQEVLM